MSTGVEPTITLTEEDDWWVARDTATGITSQGRTRREALDNLDDAIALARGDAGDEPTDAALRDAGIEPTDNETGDDEPPDALQ